MARRAIFLDRDGTLNVDVGFTHRVEDLRFVTGVVEGLRRLDELGFLLVITTNQSGIARGYFTRQEMHAFNAALESRLREFGISIADVYYCPFHPHARVGLYRCDSPMRKPKPGMILRAAEEHGFDLSASFAIGDRATDVMAGQAAGCRTILVGSASGEPAEYALQAGADFRAADLVEAARFVEQAERRSTGVSPEGDSPYPGGLSPADNFARRRA